MSCDCGCETDYELGENVTALARPGNKKKREVVLSVRLSAEEFDHLSALAEAQGKYTSQMAREIIHERVFAAGTVSNLAVATGPGWNISVRSG